MASMEKFLSSGNLLMSIYLTLFYFRKLTVDQVNPSKFQIMLLFITILSTPTALGLSGELLFVLKIILIFFLFYSPHLMLSMLQKLKLCYPTPPFTFFSVYNPKGARETSKHISFLCLISMSTPFS